ncbi:hypothetical protein [Thiocapsa marina]|uniref:hypothetical protein n=1 Tax=Thiocapsa marina TaxID=244573 RepID=UPI00111268D6|nr:hypothetical protein [Thiocapsa marina]
MKVPHCTLDPVSGARLSANGDAIASPSLDKTAIPVRRALRRYSPSVNAAKLRLSTHRRLP